MSPLSDLSPETEEVEEAVDEKWLVSYSDMMTLLFGLFVMLYAMSHRMDQVKKSAARQFAGAVPGAADAALPNSLPSELESTKQKLADTEDALTEAKKRFAALTDADQESLNKEEDMIAGLKRQLAQAKSRRVPTVKPNHPDKGNADLLAKISELEKEDHQEEEQVLELEKKNRTLERQLAQVSQTETKVSTQSSSMQQALNQTKKLESEQAAKLSSMKRTLASQIQASEGAKAKEEQLQSLLSAKTEEISQLKAANSEDEKRLATQSAKLAEYDAKQAKSSGPFAAVVITWASQNHDIDLIVTDPAGQSFDYRRRSHPNHPGKFVLDTRRGPGAEMWETSRLIPGIYKINYVFYNTYGNNEPAQVFGRIYSQEGIFELPKVELNFSGKRERTFKVKISKDGEVAVVQ